ncbi:nickel pincer cofactor biosynthesis protein LarC [Leptolyngbya sp. AN03gr2]|uniref:nickel pincer cofactor biosynthesis protein LarC n=1 Tax=unclassified Leptolyngbya TaxID=2650499 RepID=UPI003D320D0A
MSKIAYLDCPTGIAGDMCLGALVDLGVPLAYLTECLDRLGISEEYELSAESVQRNGQRATKIQVKLQSDTKHSHKHKHSHDHHNHDPDHEHHHDHKHSHDHEHHHHHDKLRHLPEIEEMIYGAKLPPRAEAWSLAVFRQLAIAEGAVHGIAPEAVHFHEVGAIDAIVDIVGTCLGFDWLNVDRIICSPLPTGGGTVWAAHGRLPVPVPAVLKLFELRQVPIYSNGIEKELVTPTGAAIVTTLAKSFSAPPKMTLQKVGLGAGTIDLPIPNMIRIWIGTTEEQSHQSSTPETVTVLETQIDDLSPQAIGYLFDTLLEAGALDVFTQAIGMKKSRPGILLTVICSSEKVDECETILFRETTTLGIRRTTQQRTILDRRFEQVNTEYGAIQVKIASRNGSIVNVQPEYEDCVRIARKVDLPWREVHRIALQTWHLAHS